MKFPWWLRIIMAIFIIVGLAAFGLNFCRDRLLENLGYLALVLTLVAVIAYVHYTHELARVAWEPSASFSLARVENEPYQIGFIVKNHSKLSLQCWCKINATVYGQSVSLPGFYGTEHSWDIQPYGKGTGNFLIREILAKAKRNVDEMKEKASGDDPKKQLYLEIDFWYTTFDKKITIENPRISYYFDFTRERMILDV